MQEALTLASSFLEIKDREPAEILRKKLREATSAAHDRLDNLMRDAAGWTTRDEYVQFLQLQLAARAPIEMWLKANAARHLHPPAQCAHIANDLTSMDAKAPFEWVTSPTNFTIPSALEDNKDASALGAAWTLAGSALGNHAILKDMRRAATQQGSDAWPHSFLGDPDMLAFWGVLRRQIERPASSSETCAAVQASLAVFNHFIAIAEAHLAAAGRHSVGANDERPTLAHSHHSCPAVHQ